MHSFVYRMCKYLGKYFLYLKYIGCFTLYRLHIYIDAAQKFVTGQVDYLQSSHSIQTPKFL